MGCKPTVCKVCGKPRPACQVKDGICALCRSKAAQLPQEKK